MIFLLDDFSFTFLNRLQQLLVVLECWIVAGAWVWNFNSPAKRENSSGKGTNRKIHSNLLQFAALVESWWVRLNVWCARIYNVMSHGVHVEPFILEVFSFTQLCGGASLPNVLIEWFHQIIFTFFFGFFQWALAIGQCCTQFLFNDALFSLCRFYTFCDEMFAFLFCANTIPFRYWICHFWIVFQRRKAFRCFF